METRNLFRLPLSLRTIFKPSFARPPIPQTRTLATTPCLHDVKNSTPSSSPTSNTPKPSENRTHSALGQLGAGLSQNSRPLFGSQTTTGSQTTDYGMPKPSALDHHINQRWAKEHHLHVYSHKHNTHLTFSGPERNTLISVSSGNLGFRKSQRGSFDAAFQLMAYMLSRIQQQGLMGKIERLELVLRGFGQGRDAVTKVLLGQEGARLRDKVVRVVDKTRLKIGGPRSPKPRRLG
jgi:small subunit ribosomal protein S11